MTEPAPAHIVLSCRGDTTVVDAYLTPILRRYVDRLAGKLAGSRLVFMQSNGGLTDAQRFQGKVGVLSGPAGGIVGMVRTSEAAGFDRIIGFDMGGTSTDVSHYAGTLEREFDTKVAGAHLRRYRGIASWSQWPISEAEAQAFEALRRDAKIKYSL